MTDYAIIQTVQQVRILLQATLLPLAGLGIIAFAAVKMAGARRSRQERLDSREAEALHQRIDRLERTIASLDGRGPRGAELKRISERLDTLETLVVDRELEG